jgi:hypothetical protein
MGQDARRLKTDDAVCSDAVTMKTDDGVLLKSSLLRVWLAPDSPRILNYTYSPTNWFTVTIHEGVRGGYHQCTCWNGTKTVMGQFATGRQSDVVPPLPAHECGFLGPPRTLMRLSL